MATKINPFLGGKLDYVGGAGGGLTNINISAGTTSNNLSAVTFSNSNGVSFGLNGSVITASVNAAGGGLTNINVSAGTTSNNLSAITFNNANGITFGLNASTITASHNALTTAMASNRGSDFVQAGAVFNGTNASGTIASNGISVSVGNYITTAMLSNAVTLSNINVSAGTTSNNLSALTFSNSNGVSFGLNGSVVTATVATNYQSQGAYLTTAMLSNAVTLSNIRVSAGTTSNLLSAITFSNSNGITFGLNASTVTASHNGLTTAALSNHSHGVSFTSGSVAFQTLSFTNSNGISFNSGTQGIFGSHNAITTGALSNHSHGNPTLNLTNLSGTTASNSAGFTLSLSAAAPGAGGGFAAQGSGAYTQNTGTIQWANSNGITFGLSTNQMTASHNGLTTAAQSNHSHGNPTLNLTNISGTTASASNGFTLSLSAAAPGAGAGITFNSTIIGAELGWAQSSSSLGINSIYFLPHNFQNAISAIAVKVPFMMTNSSFSSSSGQAGYTARFGIYTTNATNSTVLTLHYSTSYTMAVVNSSNVSRAVSLISAIGNSTSYNTFSSSSAGLNLSSLVHGPREMILPISSLLTAGKYWFAWHHSSSLAGTSQNVMVVSHLIMSSQTQARFGVATTAVTGEGIAKNIGQGTYSVTSGALPNAVSLTQINKAATNPIFFIVPSTR